MLVRMESWAIDVHKEYFKFSCAHFLIFPDGSKGRLHGHNYQVSVEIVGALGERGLVIDFLHVKPIVRELCDELDEHWVVPGQHPEFEISQRDDGHVALHYRDAHYLAPSDEVLVLPLNNTSAENLATWIGRELRGRLVARFGATQVRALEVAVSETPGQRGIYRYGDA